jgi:hypothetical protein
VGGKKPENFPDETGITFVSTDTALDLYRTGLCAELFAGEKKIIIFDDGLFPEESREALREDFRARDFPSELVFLASHSRYSPYSEVGCVVVAGPATGFLDQELDIPVILFSWNDPEMTPRVVKLIFDDSPWALAGEALKSLSSSDGMVIPSVPAVFPDRMDEKKDFRKLKGLLKKNLHKN